jgi:protein phosphatase
MRVETATMVTIGRFARLTGLTVKALRHYDELGLLKPARVDAWTGYRWYEPAQAARRWPCAGCGRCASRSSRWPC